MAITKNKVVTLEYTLRDAQGNLIDSTDGHEPLSYLHGHGTLFPALETRLEGHASGEHLYVTLSPEQAYGERDEGLIKRVPRERFKASEPLHPGMSFRYGSGDEEMEVILVAMDEKEVSVDANPPLAGVELHFDLVITGVRDAGSEELESGRVSSIDEVYAQPRPE